MTDRTIGTREEWLAAREALLVREKEHTRLGDELARQRRELPWVPLEKEYRFETEEGTRTLAELFAGRSQLVVYHFMFGPGYTAGCPTCSATADSFNGVLPHLEAADVTMICISRAPLEKLLAYRRRMGWSFNWASTYESDFNFDFGVSAAEDGPHEAAPLLEANEVAARPLLRDQDVRDSLPPVAKYNAERNRHRRGRLLRRGARRQRLRARGQQCLPLLLQLRPRQRVPDELLRDPRPDADEVASHADAIGSWVRRHDEYVA